MLAELEMKLSAAAKRLNCGSKEGSGREKAYGQAYDVLVKAGYRRRLRAKYRGL